MTRRRDLVLRWVRQKDRGLLALLAAMTVVSSVLVYQFPEGVPAGTLLVVLLLTEVLLRPQRVPALVLFVILVLGVETALELVRDREIPLRRWVAIGLIVAMGALVVRVAVRRSRLGVGGLAGGSMLIDLQERISRNGEMPQLPGGWLVDVATRSAGETSFAGDFMVAHRAGDDSRLSLVLVDVSGKGVEAGTKSLLLSGAFGGLLGAVAPAEFLPSANEFLLRQAWDEGFATAVHLALDLQTGAYQLRTAGHPPAIHFLAGSGRWHLHDDVEGSLLGVTTGPEFPCVTGRMGSGDALMLYTDGLVERPGRDIGLGIDKLIGEGERLLRFGFAGAAQGLVDRLGSSNDDCALIILQRA